MKEENIGFFFKMLCEAIPRCSQTGKNTWCKDIKAIFAECNMINTFNALFDNSDIDLVLMEEILQTNYKASWNNNRLSMSKLITYNKIYDDIEVRFYVRCRFISRRCRSIIAQTISGTLPIEIERGRWRNLPVDQRICKQCDMNQIETLEHFMFLCPANARQRPPIFINQDITQLLLDDTNIKTVANFIILSMQGRK